MEEKWAKNQSQQQRMEDLREKEFGNDCNFYE